MLGSSLTHVFGAVSALCLLGAPVRASDGARNLSPDDDVLQEAKIGSNRAALLDYMHKRSPAGVDPQRLDELIQQLGSMRFQDRQQASKKLVSLGPAILPLLRGAQKDTDTERAARAIDCIQEIERNWNSALSLAVIRAVVHHYPAEAGEALLGFLPHVACDPEVEEEIWFALDRLAARASSQHPAFLNALRDPFPIRRAAAACILGRRGEQRERAVVRHLLADPDPVVRLRCAQGLLAAREKDAIPVLIALLDKTGVDVSWQAEELLHWVAGEDSPAVTIGSGYQEAAATCRQAWEAWWRQQGPRLNLEKLDVDYRKPGLALVSGYEMVRRGKEQQEESHLSLYGCDGKPRWQVKTVPGSSCAELLPNGRLLMPLLDEFGLCEKDLHGNILWQYKLPYPVYSCQRLPDGNTFIANLRMRFQEVTPEGKKVNSGDFGIRGDLPGAECPQRLINGHLLCRTVRVERAKSFTSLVELESGTGRVLRNVPLPYSIHPRTTVQALHDGHFLLAGNETSEVVEVNSTGESVWRCAVPAVSQAIRLRDGNTLVACELRLGGRLAEIDRGGRMVSEALLRCHPNHFQVCFALLRLGFGRRPTEDLDLATSVPHRVKGLKSKDAFIRSVSASQLETLGPKAAPAASALIKALSDPDDLVRLAAMNALGSISPKVIPDLVKAWDGESPRLRPSLAWILGQYEEDGEMAVPTLINGLKDDNVVVRRKAAWALGRIGPRARAAVPSLIQALNDKDVVSDHSDVSVSYAAVTSLGNIGSDAALAVPALVNMLTTKEIPLRNLIIVAVGQIGSSAKDAVPALSGILKDKTANSSVRVNAASALGKIGPAAKDARPALRSVLMDPDELLRSKARNALERIEH